MKIYKKDNKCMVELDLLQKSYDAIGEEIGDVPNLIGNIIERKEGISEYTINNLIDLGYKGDLQIGTPIIYLDSREELEEACRELGINIDETPMCAYCDSPLFGSFTISDKGYQCYNCEQKEAKIKARIEMEDKALTDGLYKEVLDATKELELNKYYEEKSKDII
jgi:signal recognition particle subunit SEC65